uniref:Uncharacterized protein n=1 Tax=Spongospora subterranea TaxID=70186 RepID=A0A0H5QHA3_9EUKA|eukprot:CRZ01042.1 hypothetical protein [Spongospora subterranea]
MSSWSLAIILALIVPFFTDSARSPLEIITDAKELSESLLMTLIQLYGNVNVDANSWNDIPVFANQNGRLLFILIEFLQNASYPHSQEWGDIQLFYLKRAMDTLIQEAQHPNYDDSCYPLQVLLEAQRWCDGRSLHLAAQFIQEARHETDQAGVSQVEILALAQKLGPLIDNVINIINAPPIADKAFQMNFFRFLLLLDFNHDTSNTYADLYAILSINIESFRYLFFAMQFQESASSAGDQLKDLANIARMKWPHLPARIG